MSTFEELYQKARASGMNDATARAEAQLQAAYTGGVAAQAARAQTEAESEAPGFSFDRYDEMDRRMAAQFDRDRDAQRAARAAQERATIEARMKPLVEQRDALNRQIAALNEEWRRWM